MATIEALKEKVEKLIKKSEFTKARELLDKELELAPDEKKDEIKKLYDAELYKKSKSVIIKGKPIRTLFIDYDSFGEGLEPAYYWVLDFLRESLKYEVKKSQDYFAAAEASFWYGDIGTRRTALEKRASELMATINMVVKSMLNLLWDLKEFEQRLKHYKDFKEGSAQEKETADLALKAIFLTEVDIKKGRAALNMLAQELNFITIRDAFMAAKKPDDVDKMDLNERVKRVLKPRVVEYLHWVELSGKELNERYRIEKAYLKSQVHALDLYTRWAKPYLIATNKLLPPEMEKVTEPEEIVTAFDVARIYIEIYGKQKVELLRTKELGAAEIKLPEDEERYKVIEVVFNYRASPAGVVERGHFTHRGRVRITFNAYIMAKKHIDILEQQDKNELLKFVAGMTTETLEAMQEDLDKYVKEEKPKEKKKELKIPVFETAREIVKPFKEAAEGIKKFVPVAKPKVSAWDIARVEKEASDKVKKELFVIYESYKKSHAMITW